MSTAGHTDNDHDSILFLEDKWDKKHTLIDTRHQSCNVK